MPAPTPLPPDGPGSAEVRALGAFTAAVAVVLAVVVVLAVHASLPANALRLAPAEALHLRVWLPQGWGYFSGEARAPGVTAYVAGSDGRWRAVPLAHQGAARTLLGLDRSGRVAEQEVTLLEARATREPEECRGPDATCLAELAPGPEVDNPATRPRLCGDVALVRREPVPWAWAGSADPDDMPATAVRLEVSC